MTGGDRQDQRLSIGFSPCPNDTFIFHALMHGEVGDCAGFFAEEILADVETLNVWALAAKLDITKLSFHALGHVLDNYVLLTAGGALGRGCGPLLVAGPGVSVEGLSEKRIAIPGRYTTAAMLLQLFAPQCRKLAVMRFDEIMPSIAAGTVDAGVIIHESRFTFQQYGLRQLQDLGAWWEEATGFPIPLGGIAARRALGRETIQRINRCIGQSVRLAFEDPARPWPYIKAHAQELDDRVISDHIGLYVNSFSEDLGGEGLGAVREFLRRGQSAGFFPPFKDSPALSSNEL